MRDVLRGVAWEEIGGIAQRLVVLGIIYFLSAWVVMIFWGMVAADANFGTISYNTALLGLVAVWIVIIPVHLLWAPMTRWPPG